MNAGKTHISEKNITFIREEERTPRQIADFLKAGASFRSFSYLLQQLCPQKKIKETLIDGLSELSGEEREQTARKVRNWMSGKNLPKNREMLFQICFVLQLDEGKSSKVLGMVSDTGIHYRNPEELAYAFALRSGKTYREALVLRERALRLYQKEKDAFTQNTPDMYTRQLQEEFARITAEAEFFEFVRKHAKELGKLHETAYEKFVELLDILQKPGTEWGEPGTGEGYYTLNQVMEQYIRMHVPGQLKGSGKRQEGADGRRKVCAGALTPLQKRIKRYWPNEEMLVRMRNRSEDVSRKALLLLYLVTESFDSRPEETEYYYEDLEEDADTMLEIRWKKMDLFLNIYGMNPLDPGNPFDLLVIYSMRARGEDDVQARMDRMLEQVFLEAGTEEERNL